MERHKLELIALLVVGGSLLLWSMGRHPIQIIHVREQGRMAVSELRSGSGHERISDPIQLFRASLSEIYPANSQVPRTVYVPAYPAIRIMSGRSRVDLATTLSIHNTSRERPLVLERVDYHGTDGALIQAHLEEPVALKPLGTIEMFVARDDRRGGTGANFVVDWAADGPISEPVIEAVMIGTQGNATDPFVSPGRSTHIVPRSEETDQVGKNRSDWQARADTGREYRPVSDGLDGRQYFPRQYR